MLTVAHAIRGTKCGFIFFQEPHVIVLQQYDKEVDWRPEEDVSVHSA